MDGIEPPISFSHIFRTLRTYRGVIFVSFMAVVIGYAILAIVLYLFSSSTRVTSLQFRLNFDGASIGQYPNGMKFSPVEIVSTPVLQRVYKKNNLERFLTLDELSKSVYVLESNPAYDALVREYEARLSDAKLTPLDRERIQKEFDLRRDALSKNVFSINFQHTSANRSLPESSVRELLVDTLNEWAWVAVNERHAVDYRVAVLSPEIIGDGIGPEQGYLESLLVLRSQLGSVLQNVSVVAKLPGAELVKTKEHQTIEEVRLQLEQILRFEIDPLIGYVIDKHAIKDAATTQRFAENQLAYDQRKLDSDAARADAARQALAVYAQRQERTDVTPLTKGTDGVVPQVSEGFIDRVVDLATHSSDAGFRQNLAVEYRKLEEAKIPTAAAVAYDKSLIDLLRNSGSGPNAADSAYVIKTITDARQRVRALIGNVNEIYQATSTNLRPSTELFTMTAPAVTRIERTGSTMRLLFAGVAVMLFSFVVIIAGVFLHSRVKEEEAAEEAEADVAAPISTPALT